MSATDAQRFLAALAHIDVSALDTHKFCFQTIVNPPLPYLKRIGAVSGHTTHRTGTFSSLESWLRKSNAIDDGGYCGVYVCVNSTDGKGRKLGNILGIRALFVELDHGGLNDSHYSEMVDRFKPSIIVESSPGKAHIYWLLNIDSCPLDKFSTLQSVLAYRFAGLRAGTESKDLPRVLRVPSFANLKNLEEPFQVRLAHCNPALLYSPTEVLALVGIDADYIRDWKQKSGNQSLAGTSSSIPDQVRASIGDAYDTYLGAGDGSRNSALFHYTLKHLIEKRGMNELEALSGAILANHLNVPPLEKEEVKALVHSAWTRFVERGAPAQMAPGVAQEVFDEWDPLDTSLDGTQEYDDLHFEYNYDRLGMSVPVSEVSLAERMIQKRGSKLRHEPVSGFFYYNGLIWAHGAPALKALSLHMREDFSQVPMEPVIQAYFTKPSGFDVPGHRAFAKSIHSKSVLKNVADLLSLSPEIAARATDFNREEESDFLACKNGIISLREGRLVDPDPAYKLTEMIDVEFDPLASCPTWDYFISSCMNGDPDLIDYLQRVTGYLISGRTHLQCLFVAFGVGGTGKSKYLDALGSLMGPYCHELDANVILANKGSENAKMSSLAQAMHCRIATVQETSGEDHWSEPVVKALTGNDTISAKLSHKDTVNFKPRFKMLIRANSLPSSRVLDGAMWARLKFLPFEKVFRGTSEEDPFISEKLAKELPGILAWAVKGFQKLMADGLQEPLGAKNVKKQERREAEPLRTFVEEHCVKCANKDGLTFPEFYTHYSNWCVGEGREIEGKHNARKQIFAELGVNEKVIRQNEEIKKQINLCLRNPSAKNNVILVDFTP